MSLACDASLSPRAATDRSAATADDEAEVESLYEKQGYIINASNLRRLCVRDLFVNRGPKYFDLLLKPLPLATRNEESLGSLDGSRPFDCP